LKSPITTALRHPHLHPIDEIRIASIFRESWLKLHKLSCQPWWKLLDRVLGNPV
jgi:hypothetical protein